MKDGRDEHGKILLTGSSGLIGTSLAATLRRRGVPCFSLFRRPRPGSSDTEGLWNPYAATPLSEPRSLLGTTAAVHLSGANFASRRWTSSYKREILDSRVRPTFVLASLLAGLRPKPSVLVCASAAAIYGSRGKEVLTEDSTPGWGFLPEVCLAWEKATRPASDAGIRVVHLRFGIVLSPHGGTLAWMLPIFRVGMGGQLGSGRQWMSWVTLHDAIRAIEFAIETESLSGPLNVAAPNPVTNAEFTGTLGNVLHRPTPLRIPTLVLRIGFGEMMEATILESKRVMPARLHRASFRFEHPVLAHALQALVHGP